MDFEKIEKIAESLVEKYFISEPPINVKLLAEKEGFSVLEENLNAEVSGFLIIESNKKVIGIDKSENNKRRNRFTIAHEMGHYYLHHLDSGTHIDERIVYNRGKYSNRRETEANVFAAALLMPTPIIKQTIKKNFKRLIDENDIIKLAKQFEVSEIAMTFRLKNIGIADF